MRPTVHVFSGLSPDLWVAALFTYDKAKHRPCPLCLSLLTRLDTAPPTSWSLSHDWSAEVRTLCPSKLANRRGKHFLVWQLIETCPASHLRAKQNPPAETFWLWDLFIATAWIQSVFTFICFPPPVLLRYDWMVFAFDKLPRLHWTSNIHVGMGAAEITMTLFSQSSPWNREKIYGSKESLYLSDCKKCSTGWRVPR